MTRIVASNAEVIAVHEKLKAVIVAIEGEKDVVRYLDGWSDERVQKEVAPRLTPEHVGRLRTEMFGRLKRADKDDPVLAEEVARHRRLIDHLFEKLGEPVPML